MSIQANATRLLASSFRSEEDIKYGKPRSIGLENEYVMVSADGNIVPPEVLYALWGALEQQGWQLTYDPITSKTTAALQPAASAAPKGTHNYHVITTDLAYSTLEIDVAPACSLSEAQVYLCQLIDLVTSILAKHQAYVLGYGVQPIAPPTRAYIGPKNRYALVFDAHEDEHPGNSLLGLQCLNASCQTQIELSAREAIPLVNAFNATSGLRIALFANSPVWQNTQSEYKALRELFWDWCYFRRRQQFGIPPRFQSLEHYVDYLFDFRAILVIRDHISYRINNNISFRTFANSQTDYIGIASDGRQAACSAEAEDLYTQHSFAWFDARLHPLHGTIEDRVSCQQPPHAHFCANALTLGLVENGTKLIELADQLSLDQWREIRQLACKHGTRFSYSGVNSKQILEELVQIALTGLKQRAMGEEKYLEPLQKRLELDRCPADDVMDLFQEGGVPRIIACHDMQQLSLHCKA